MHRLTPTLIDDILSQFSCGNREILPFCIIHTIKEGLLILFYNSWYSMTQGGTMSAPVYILIMLVIIGAMVGLIIYFLKKKGTETLFNACQDGDLRKAKSLIRNDPGLIDIYDPSGSTPLLVSVENGHLNIAEILIYRGANVNLSGNLGVTPLHLAAERGFDDMVRLLIQKGAMLQAKDEMGASPLHYAVEKGKASIVQILLEKGSEPGETDNSGDTAIKIAVSKGRKDIIDMLKAHMAKE